MPKVKVPVVGTSLIKLNYKSPQNKLFKKLPHSARLWLGVELELYYLLLHYNDISLIITWKAKKKCDIFSQDQREI